MKALVSVQGINSKDDYLGELIRLETNKELNSRYDTIRTVKTEEYFDSQVKLPSFLKNSFTAQYLGDIWTFYKSRQGRKEVCRITRLKIEKLQEEGYEVDVIAHSLGTVITLCAGPNKLSLKKSVLQVNNFYCLASPLGIGNSLLRNGLWFIFEGTINHFLKFHTNFIAKTIIYCYSENDFLSKVKDEKFVRGLKHNSVREVIYKYASSSFKVNHSVQKYLDFLKGKI